MLIALAFASLGAFIGLRTGSGEAVQGAFPLFFVFLFLSSSSLPRNLIEHDWSARSRPTTRSRICLRASDR
jgi:ABC-2 type transport system permease protein